MSVDMSKAVNGQVSLSSLVNSEKGKAAGNEMTKILRNELVSLEGLYQTQNPESGAPGKGKTIFDGKTSYLDEYTNKIFGAPFQLMDTVDKRFDEVNRNVGNEYLRNFLINTPILHIKPGKPKYTGGDDANNIVTSVGNVFLGSSSSGGNGFVKSLLTELSSSALKMAGGKLQKRMYGFQETYYNYISYVNYMCRSMATFLNIGSYKCRNAHGDYMVFSNAKWENYRWLKLSVYRSPSKVLGDIWDSTYLGATLTSLKDVFNTTISSIVGKNKTTKTIATTVSNVLESNSFYDVLSSLSTGIKETYDNTVGAVGNTASWLFGTTLEEKWDDTTGFVKDAANGVIDKGKDLIEKVLNNFKKADETSLYDVSIDRICSVLFMVEPGPFEESITNTIENSAIESGLDAVGSAVGKEIAFITNSNTDLGIIDNLAEFVGGGVESLASIIGDIVEPVTGGFMSNLFSGAIRSIKGEKMIYPKIYKNSESKQDYNFTVTLKSPYGDVYNYYMNIVVPLMHLIALVAPKMSTANSVQSPFVVQAFIPGMVTCQLGMISNMTIIKNPDNRRVSVNGFPLDIKVTFTIEEMYNALAISPANDPSSFFFNETLNDYMANLAGLQPSVNTYMAQRNNALNNLGSWLSSGEIGEELAQQTLESAENLFNPYKRQGK